MPHAVAGAQLDVAGQELIAGYAHQMHYHFSLDLRQKVEISPHWTVNGSKKMIPSEQVEA